MICDLCKKEIDMEKERYVHIEDYDKQEMVKDMWVHLQCFGKGMNKELTELEANAKKMLQTAGNVFNNFINRVEPELNKEEYVIQ